MSKTWNAIAAERKKQAGRTWDEIVAERKKQQASAKTWDDIVRERGGTTKKAESAAKSKLGQVFDRPGSGVSTSKAAPKKTMAEQMAYAGSRDRDLRTAEIVKSKTSAPTDSTQKTASVPYMPGYTQFKQAQTVFRNAKAQAAQEAERQTVYNAAAREIAARRTAGGTDALLASPENRQSLRAATPATRKTVVLPDTMAERQTGTQTQPPVVLTKNDLALANAKQKFKNAGEFTGNVVLSGLNRWNSRLMKTLDFLLPTDNLGKYDVVSRLNDYYGKQSARMDANLNASGEKLGKGWATAGNFLASTVSSVPDYILALMTGGGSLGAESATGAAAASSGLKQTLGTAVKTFAKNPMYWESFAQTSGSTYEQAKADGASELEASATAVVSGLLNAVVEVGGGIETMPRDVSGIRTWVKSLLEEGKEEVLQGAIENLTRKAFFDKASPYYSMSDQNAVVNPARAAQEFAGGAVAAGLLGAGQLAAGGLYNSLAGSNTETGAQGGVDEATLYEAGAEILQAGRQDAVIAAGLAAPEGSAARTMAEKLKAKQDAGKAVSAADLGGLVLENIREVSGKTAAEAEAAEEAPNTVQTPVRNRPAGIQASIRTDANGGKYTVIDTGQDAFKDAPVSAHANIAKQIILKRFKGKTLPVSENDLARVNGKSAGEYAYPRTPLDTAASSAKAKASAELDNLLEASTYSHSAHDDGRHPEAKLGWDYYTTRFVVDGKTFEGLINIANSENGRVFYDVTKIRELPVFHGGPAAGSAQSTPEFEKSSVPSIPASNGNDNTHILQNGDTSARREAGSENYAQVSAADEEVRLRRELDRMAAGQTAPAEQGANPTGSANASGANPQGPLAAAAERARTQTVDRDQAKRAIRATPGKRHEKISSFTVDWFEALGREIGAKMQWFDDASPDALDGLYDNGTIYINLQAQKPADAVFRHELTHYLEETNPEGYARLLGILQEADPDALETVRANLRVKYAESGKLIGDEQLDRELVANMAETVLTDDQTARAIAQSDPSLAGTILSWIRRMLRAITNVGHKQASLAPELLEKYSPAGTFSRDGLNRARVIYKDVVRTTKPAPEKAGRANTRTVGAQASIRTADNGEKYTVIDTGQDVFKDAPVSAYPAIARRVIRAKFVGETLPVSENDLADVTNKSAGEYAYPHNVPAYTENRAKMKASTELDNLLAASTYSHSAPDDRRHSIASRGWDYYNTTFVVDGKTFRGLVNIAKSPNGKTFYDITKIQEAPDMSGREAAAPAAPKSTPAFRDPYANSIPTSDGNDNTHFLQNNDNAAGQDGQSGGPQASIRLGDITQTPEEKIERNKDDPHNSEEYRAYASDTTFPTAEGETAFARPDVAGAVKSGSVFADHVGISKDLTRNLNTAFAASPTARERARQELERPLWQAKGGYAKGVQAARKGLYDSVVEKLGIRAHSPESAAIMWYGEGVRQISAPGKRPDGKKFELEAYTLDDLKREFDYTAKNGKKAWENVVEAEKYFRKTYDNYVERINQANEVIYPDVEERAQADYESKRAAADSHLQRAEHFERDARQTLHEIETRAGNARQELTEKHDAAMRYADEIEAGGAQERDDLLRQADETRAEAGRLRADAAKKRRRDTKAYADLIRKAERSETQAGRFEAQAKSAQATEDARAAKIRNSAVLLLERAELFRQDAQNAGQSGAYRRAMAAAERARTQYRKTLSEAQDIARSIEDGSILRNKRLTPREDYFHHFMEMQRGMGSLSDILNASTDIDPQLVGKSEFTQPNSKWTGFMQRRRGGRYMEDAVGGLLSYIPQAEYKINIEPLIPHFRACVRDLADATGETRNANQLISFLIDFTNDIAGKTNPIDRTVLRWFGDQNGRQLLNVLGRISKRPRVNAVAGNIGTVIVQFSNIPNIAAYVNNPATMALGTYDAVRALAGDPEARAALDQSIFLRERYLDQSERKFSVGAGEHLEDVLSLLMEAGDQASTTAGWFALYRQKLKRGGTAEQAVEYADEYIRLAVGGRGIGEVPLAQKARLTKALAPFQVEVNNTWRLLTDIVHGRDALAFLKMAVAGWLLNRLYEKLMGRSIVFDPIDATADAVQTLVNPDNGSVGKRALMAAGRIGGEVLNAVPFGGYVASGVIQDEETRKMLFGDRDPTRFGLGNIGVNTLVQPIADLAQGYDVDLLRPALMYAVPFGGRQIEKTIRGLQDLTVLPKEHINPEKHIFSFDRVAFPSSRTDSGDIRFAIDAANPFEVLAAVLLGTSATKAAQAYYGGDGKPLSAGDTLRTDTAVTAFGIAPEDYMRYNREIKDVQGTKNAKGNTVSGSVQANKMKYAGGLPLSAGQKAAVYELSNKRTPPDEDVRALSRETGLTLGTVRAAQDAYMRILPGYRGGKTDADSLRRQFADYLKTQDMTNAQRLAVYNFFLGIKEE